MATATGVTRMADAGMVTLPRLCVAAAIQAVERLANHQDETMRALAVPAADDLRVALEDGLESISGLLALLDTTTEAPRV